MQALSASASSATVITLSHIRTSLAMRRRLSLVPVLVRSSQNFFINGNIVDTLQLRGPCIFHYYACIQFFEPASYVRDPARLGVRGFGGREFENGVDEPGLEL